MCLRSSYACNSSLSSPSDVSSSVSSVIDEEESNEEVCDCSWLKCGFGVNFVNKCVGLAFDPKVSRSGKDFECFSSDADLLLIIKYIIKEKL